MKKFSLLLLLLLLCTIASGVTEVIRWVDTGATGSADGTSEANAYTTLNAAIVAEAKDITASDEQFTFRCLASGSVNDTTSVDITGWSTDADNYILIYGWDFPFTGIFDTGAYVIENDDDSTYAIRISEEFVRIERIQVLITGTSGTHYGIEGNVSTSTSDIRIDSCIVKGAYTGTGLGQGIRFNSGGPPVTITNTVVTDIVSGADSDFLGIRLNDGGSSVKGVYNCTVWNCYRGIFRLGGTPVVKNCAVGNCVDDFFGAMNIDYCISDDGDGTNPQNPLSLDWDGEFSDANNGDFTLVAGGNTIDNGTENPSSGIYFDDIVGTNRVYPWDIGAYELKVTPPIGAGGQTIQRAIFPEEIRRRFLPPVLSTTSTPTFANIILTDLTPGSVVFVDTDESMGEDPLNFTYNETTGVLTTKGQITNGTIAIGHDYSGGTYSTAIQKWPAGTIQSTGDIVFQSTVDSTTAYQWLNAAGDATVLNIDTDGEMVGIKTDTPFATLDIGGYGAPDVIAVNAFNLGIKQNVNGIMGIEIQNTSTGNAADQRIAMVAEPSVYMAFSMPGVNNSDSLFGKIRNTTVYLFTFGARNLTLGTVFPQDIILGTSNIERIRIKGATGFTGFGGEEAAETLIELTHAQPYITLHNSTHEDTDGGRESRLNFKGEQSGGEETALVRIEVAHDGTGDDEKGYWDLFINAGSDGDSPTKAIRVDSNGDMSLFNGAERRYYDVGNSNYVGFQAPALTGNQIWTLPDADGADGDVMFTDGAGNLKWGANASTRAFTFSSPSGGSGTTYAGGHYRFGATDNDFNPSITFGMANAAYGDHVFIVAAAGASGGTDTVIRVTGTSITDAAARVTLDTEDLTADDAGAAGAYYETVKKWVGQVTIVVLSGPDLLCNYGGAKYWDDNNEDFKVEGVDVTWLGGANDATPNLILRHHKATGWTYNAGSTPTPPTPIATMNTDYVTETQVLSGEEGAWKRTNLSTNVNGSGSEGTMIEVVTTANKTFELGNFLMRVVPQ